MKLFSPSHISLSHQYPPTDLPQFCCNTTLRNSPGLRKFTLTAFISATVQTSAGLCVKWLRLFTHAPRQFLHMKRRKIELCNSPKLKSRGIWRSVVGLVHPFFLEFLTVKEIGSFETSETTRRTTRRHTPQHLHLQQHYLAEPQVSSCSFKIDGWAQADTFAVFCLARTDCNPSKPTDNSTTNRTPQQYTLCPRRVFTRELSALRRGVTEVFVFGRGSVSLGNQFSAFVAWWYRNVGDSLPKITETFASMCFLCFSEQTAIISL